MVNRSCIDAANITSTFSGFLQPSLVLADPIAVGSGVDRSQLLTESLVCVYLSEHVEIALVASFKGLIGLFVAEDFCSALQQIRILYD